MFARTGWQCKQVQKTKATGDCGKRALIVIATVVSIFVCHCPSCMRYLNRELFCCA